MKDKNYLPVYNNQFDSLNQMIGNAQIQPADGIEVIDPSFPLLKHYFTFATTDELGFNWFFVAYASIGEVKLEREDNIALLANRYKLNRVIPFYGDYQTRRRALMRGKSLLGKEYSWVGRNCENVINYIQTGKSYSEQTRVAGASAVVAGVALTSSKNKYVQGFGGVIAIAGLFSVLIDLFGESNP